MIHLGLKENKNIINDFEKVVSVPNRPEGKTHENTVLLTNLILYRYLNNLCGTFFIKLTLSMM